MVEGGASTSRAVAERAMQTRGVVRTPYADRVLTPTNHLPPLSHHMRSQVVPSDAGPTIAGVSGAAAVPQFLYELAAAVADGALEPPHALTALAAAGIAGDAAAEEIAHALWCVLTF